MAAGEAGQGKHVLEEGRGGAGMGTPKNVHQNWPQPGTFVFSHIKILVQGSNRRF